MIAPISDSASMVRRCPYEASATSSDLSGQNFLRLAGDVGQDRHPDQAGKENAMLPLAIAMGAVVWATIGYALFSRDPPNPG
jgi:hypothetical protein